MLEIKLTLEKEDLLPYCRKCGRIPSGAHYLYRAVNRGETLAAGLFEVGGDAVRFLHYETEEQDAFLLDGILRAGLNYADSQGIPNGEIPEELRNAYGALFAKLNYPADHRFNITNFFEKYKNCQV